MVLVKFQLGKYTAHPRICCILISAISSPVLERDSSTSSQRFFVASAFPSSMINSRFASYIVLISMENLRINYFPGINFFLHFPEASSFNITHEKPHQTPTPTGPAFHFYLKDSFIVAKHLTKNQN